MESYNILSEARPQSPLSHNSMSLSSPETPDERPERSPHESEPKISLTKTDKQPQFMTLPKVERQAAFSPPSNTTNKLGVKRVERVHSEVTVEKDRFPEPRSCKSAKSQIDDKLSKYLGLDLEPEKEVSRSFYSQLLDAEMKKMEQVEKDKTSRVNSHKSTSRVLY